MKFVTIMTKMPSLLSLSPMMGEQLTTLFTLPSTRTGFGGMTGPFAK